MNSWIYSSTTRLHHTAHCAEKTLVHRFVSAERVGQREVGGFTRRVTCTWWLLGLAVKVMVGTKWSTSHPDCMDRLTKHYSHLVGGLISGKEGCLGSERVYDNQEC